MNKYLCFSGISGTNTGDWSLTQDLDPFTLSFTNKVEICHFRFSLKEMPHQITPTTTKWDTNLHENLSVCSLGWSLIESSLFLQSLEGIIVFSILCSEKTILLQLCFKDVHADSFPLLRL